jgi:hypothetical protein
MRFHGVCGRLGSHPLHKNRLLGDTLFKNPDRPSKAAGLETPENLSVTIRKSRENPLSGFTYIENNVAAIADYSEPWDYGEIISTAFAESTVDLVVSKRFAKKQQMQWSKKGAHRLLQTRTRTLDGTLRDLFTSWYPAMPANDVQPAPLASAA